MALQYSNSWIVSFFFIIFFLYCHSVVVQPYDHHFSNLSNTWTNDESIPHSFHFQPIGITIRTILLGGTYGPKFACGFICNGECTSYLFAVFIFKTFNSEFVQPDIGAPVVVWAANRDNQVQIGATLNFTATGELVLKDVDGSTVWTTNTFGKSVVGMNLTDAGNLVLIDVDGQAVWQSFDYPTNILLPSQKLLQGHKLVPSVSLTNWTTLKDTYFFQVDNKGWFAAVESNPPQVYYRESFNINTTNENSHVTLLNGSLSFFIFSSEPNDPHFSTPIPQALTIQFMKLMHDGRLFVFEWSQDGWKVVADIFVELYGKCYPLDCGRNSICSNDHQCSCPLPSSSGIEYFRVVNDQEPALGCSESTHLACDDKLDQDFIEVKNVSYFNFIVDTMTVNKEACKQACLNKCACKAALFRYHTNSSSGDCYLPTDLFTLVNIDQDVIHYNAYTTFIKVQKVRPTKRENRVAVVLGPTIVSILLLLVVVLGFIIKFHKQKTNVEMQEEYLDQEECLDQVPGMATRFSYEELKTATDNFSKKLGEGGFGQVFEGSLNDGSKIAVKYLNEDFTKAKKSFLAEVESLGSIHHVHLVRLRGFCVWKAQYLLVYEFMSNGSLDRWIFPGDGGRVLDWERRKKIIHDVARGLAYLHHDCRQKIIHFDVKPRNILLDSDFNARVADFGLSKLVEKNQTHVIITGNIIGTPGYLAPDWSISAITEKVDVYAFGMVILVTLCGRESIDKSQPKENEYLIEVFQKCWEEGKLLDMVDKSSGDLLDNDTAVLEMIKLASWCLQWDLTKRPSMSSVVKVLEGVMQVESNLDYTFTYSNQETTMVRRDIDIDLEQLVPSFLSSQVSSNSKVVIDC